MGNTSHRVSSSSPISQFRLLETHHHLPYKLISHPKTHQVLILKQLFPEPPNDMVDMRVLLQRKLINKCAYVTQVVHWEQIGGETYCGNSTGYIVLFNNVLNNGTLRHYQKFRKSISLQQVDRIITAVLRSLKYYNALNHMPEAISADFILFDGTRAVLLDPWIFLNAVNNTQANYKSPERQMFERSQTANFNKMNSLLYEFGLLVLDLVTEQRYSIEANQRHKRININSFLEENVQDFRLRSQLSIILHPAPDKRLLIFDILLPEKLILKQVPVRRADFDSYKHARKQTGGTQRSLKRTQTSLKKMRHHTSLNPSPQRSITYHSRQTSPGSKPLQKSPQNISQNINMLGMAKGIQRPQVGTRNATQSVSNSTFTYAQMLRTPTQSVQHMSKQETPKTIYNKQEGGKHTTGWPFPHKIININTSGNVNFNINMNIEQLQSKMNAIAHSQQSNTSTKVQPFQLLDKNSNIALRSDRQQQLECCGDIQRRHASYSLNSSRVQSLNKTISRPHILNNIQFNKVQPNLSPLVSPLNSRLHLNNSYGNHMENKQIRFSSISANTFFSYQPIHNTEISNKNYNQETNTELNNQINAKQTNKQSRPASNLTILPRSSLKQGLSFGRDHWNQSMKLSPPTPSFRLKSLKNEEQTLQQLHNQFKINPNSANDGSSYEYIRYAARNKDGVMVIDPSQKQKTFESVQEQSVDAHDRTLNSQFPISEDNDGISYIRIEEGASQTTQNQHGNLTSDSEAHQVKNGLNSKSSLTSGTNTENKKQIQAKEAESIIFDSQAKQKMNIDMSKYSAFNKNTLRSIVSADQIMKQRSNFNKMINQNQNNEQAHQDQLELKQLQMQGIKKCISQKESFPHKFQPPFKEMISEPFQHSENTANKPKPSIYTHPSKLVVSIGACTLSSSDSVIDHSFVPLAKRNLHEADKDKEETKSKDKALIKRNNSSEYKIILENQFESSYLIQDLEPLEQLKSSSSSVSQPIFTSSKTLINKLKMSDRDPSVENSSPIRGSPSSRVQIQPNSKLGQVRSNLDSAHPSIPSISEQVETPSNKLSQIFHDSSNQSLKYYVIEQYPTSTNPNAIKQRYEGYKSQGKREGHGAYYYASGYVYEGDWKNNKEHGMGVLCRRRERDERPSKTTTSIINIIQDRDQYEVIYEGIWRDGELVKAIGHKKNSRQSRTSSELISNNSDPTSLANMLPSSTSLNQRNFYPVTLAPPTNPRATRMAVPLSHLALHSNSNNTAVSINISNNELKEQQNSELQAHSSRNTPQVSKLKQHPTFIKRKSLGSKKQTQLSEKIEQLWTEEAEELDDHAQQYEIPTDQPASDQSADNLRIIKLTNGDIFKGVVSLSSNGKEHVGTGKLYKVDGKQMPGCWVIKQNQIVGISNT